MTGTHGEALSLDRLSHMTLAELTALYEEAAPPASLAVLDGPLEGRMLRVVGGLGRGRAFDVVRRLAASRAFPWLGKTFTSSSAERGEGVNRVWLGGVRELYRFDTRIEASAHDGRPAVVLDYDRPGNPLLIRAIRDELRQVRDGLFLGPAYAQLIGRPRLALFFAVAR